MLLQEGTWHPVEMGGGFLCRLKAGAIGGSRGAARARRAPPGRVESDPTELWLQHTRLSLAHGRAGTRWLFCWVICESIKLKLN